MNFIQLFSVIFLILPSIYEVICDNVNVNSTNLSTSSKIHVFLLKMLGKYELFAENEPKNCVNSTRVFNCTSNVETTSVGTTRARETTATTTEALPTTSTKKRGSRKTTKATSATTDLPFVIGEIKVRLDGGKIISELVKVKDYENKLILGLLRTGKISDLLIGYFKLYTSTTERVLTDSDYYDDDEDS